MDSNFDKSLIKVLEHEGGYVYHPEDPGGETNLGVTKKVYDNWVTENDLVVKDMQDITVNDVMPIYKKNYWLKAKCDQLPIGIDYIIFDMSVNHGVSRAAKFLQGVVGAEQDVVIGSKTLAMVDKMEQSDIVEALCLEREDFYRNLKTFNTFGNGWLNRNSGVKATSLEMIAT